MIKQMARSPLRDQPCFLFWNSEMSQDSKTAPIAATQQISRACGPADAKIGTGLTA